MGLFGGFRAKLKSNKQNKHDKSGVVCTKYKIYTEFDSNPTQSPNQPSTSYKIRQINTKSDDNFFINGAKTTDKTIAEKSIETAPVEPAYDQYIDRDIDNFKAHQNIDVHDDKSEELDETPTAPLQFDSNPTQSLNQPSTSYEIKQINAKITDEKTIAEKSIETAPVEPVYDQYTDRDTDNFKVHIVDHTNQNIDEDDDKSEELDETPTTPLQYSSQAANIFFGSDNYRNHDVIMNNDDNISYASSASA